MKQFLEEKLNIVHDGVVHVNELIAMAIVVVLLLLIVLAIRDSVKSEKIKRQLYLVIERTSIRAD